MIQEVIDGVVLKLHENFDVPIYQEDIPQDFEEACFVVSSLLTYNDVKHLNRYLRTNALAIVYYPQSETQSKAEMYEIAEKLLVELEYISVHNNSIDNLLRGTKMHFEIVDDVLHFFVNYDFFVKRVVELDPIKSMEINSKVRE